MDSNNNNIITTKNLKKPSAKKNTNNIKLNKSKEEIILEWKNRNSHTFMNNSEHVCNLQNCHLFIICISKEEDIYMCKLSGKTHICDRKNCEYFYYEKCKTNGNQICCETSSSLSHKCNAAKCFLSKKYLLTPDSIIKEWKKNWFLKYSNLEDESEAENKFKDHTCNYNQCKELIDSHFQVYGCTISSKVHICSFGTCDKGVLQADATIVCIFSSNVVGVQFIANPYEKSVFNEEKNTTNFDYDENLNENEIDNINNEEMIKYENQDNYNNNNLSSINTLKPIKKRKRTSKRQLELERQFENIDCLKEETFTILKEILWNNLERQDEIRNQCITNKYKVKKLLDKYCSDCAKKSILPNQIHLDKIWDNQFHPIILQIIPFDEDKALKYFQISLNLWNLIKESPFIENPKEKKQLDWKKHVLGTLYILKEGYFINDFSTKNCNNHENKTEIVVKSDFYIKKYLIPIEYKGRLSNHTNLYNYNRRDITHGVNLIKQSINSIKWSSFLDRLITLKKKFLNFDESTTNS